MNKDDEQRRVYILRCALCKKSFNYLVSDDDKCAPGAPNQICDSCAEELLDMNHE